MRREWIGANAVLAQLTGVRHTELGYVVGSLNALAAAHLLTTDRLEPMFLTLTTNARFWPSAAIPAAGWRKTFGDDPVVFQYYPGRGLQILPLGSWGKANALASECLKHRCRQAALTRSLDRLSSLAARRSGYLAWEYYFAYGQGAPPWVSGMTQATAAQALSRGYRALGVKRWKRTALRALGAFELPSPRGVALPVPGGRHYLLYSFAPDHVVLNGGLQAVIGLRDTATLTHSREARRLFRAGDRAARREVAGFDTGAWSLYSAHGTESTYSYHDLLAGFLGGLCDRVHAQVYCRTYASFKRYEREPTRIGIPPLYKLEADHATTVRFSLSKVSSVNVRVWGKRGTSLSRSYELPRGGHAFTWVPPRRGTYKVRIEAQGPSGPVGVSSRVLKVKLPRPKPPRRVTHRGGVIRP
jgi:hypothetical protein